MDAADVENKWKSKVSQGISKAIFQYCDIRELEKKL